MTSRAERAADLLGARREGASWKAYCPVHQDEHFGEPVVGYSGEKPDMYITADGNDGWPTYGCSSQSCHDDLAPFLAVLREKLGDDLVRPLGGDAEEVLISDRPDDWPSADQLRRWTDNLTGDADESEDEHSRRLHRWADERAPALAYLSGVLGLSRRQIITERLGINAFYKQPGVDRDWGTVLTMPVRSASGAVVSVQLWKPWHPVKSRQKWWWPGSAGSVLLGADQLTSEDPRPVLVTEGLSDYLAARAAGWSVVGVTGASGVPGDLSALAGRDVVVVYDNDDAGRRGAHKIAAALMAAGARPRVADVAAMAPAVGGDLRDALALHGPEAVAAWWQAAATDALWTPLDQEVAEAAKRMLVRERARALVLGGEWSPPTDHGRLDQQLLVDDPPKEWLVEGMAEVGHNVNIVAEGKAGKTTLALNVLKALADGEPLFDHLPVAELPPGRSVAWINAELDPAQARTWLREIGVLKTERLAVLHTRGQSLDFRNPPAAAWLIRWLQEHNVDVLCADPFAALFEGEENSNTDVSAWTRAYDQIKTAAGVRSSFLITHTGHLGDDAAPRTRGAKRLFDWPDITWTYRFDPQLHTSYLGTTRGRIDGGPMADFALTFVPSERRLVWAGSQSRQDARRNHHAEAARAAVADYHAQTGERLSKTALEALLRGKTDEKRAGIDYAVELGWIVRDEVRQTKWHTPGTAPRRRFHLSGKDDG